MLYQYGIPLYLFAIVSFPIVYLHDLEILKNISWEIDFYTSIITLTYLKNWIGVVPYIWDLLFIIILILAFGKIKIPLKNVLFNLFVVLYSWFLLNMFVTFIVKGYSLSKVLGDFRNIFYYMPMFLLTYNWFKLSFSKMIIFIISISLLIQLFLSIWLQKNIFLLNRTTFQNSFLAILGIGFALAFLSQRRLKNKLIIFWVVFFISIPLAISLIAQSMTLWFCIILEFMVYTIYSLRNVQRFRIYLKTFIILLSIIVVIVFIFPKIIFYVYPNELGNTVLDSLNKRLGTINTPLLIVASRKAHLTDFSNALTLIEQSFIFGHGFGKQFHLKLFRESEAVTYFVDNAWLTLWVKVGFIGVILFFLLMLFHIRSILAVLRSPNFIHLNIYVRVLVFGYTISFPSFILASISTANLTNWISTISVVGIFMGIIEKIRIGIKKEIKSF